MREKAEELLKRYIKSDSLLKHSYASEAVMRGLAIRLNQDEDKWGIIGLLHDIDVELTRDNFEQHGRLTYEILLQNGFDKEIAEVILSHNEVASGRKRTCDVEYALASSETITGLIIATALVYPDKKLSSVKNKSVIKRMKEKNFAASVNRETIMECVNLGFSIEEFVDISIKSMMKIADKLGI